MALPIRKPEFYINLLVFILWFASTFDRFRVGLYFGLNLYGANSVYYSAQSAVYSRAAPAYIAVFLFEPVGLQRPGSSLRG